MELKNPKSKLPFRKNSKPIAFIDPDKLSNLTGRNIDDVLL